MMIKRFLLLTFLLINGFIFGQEGVFKGKIYNGSNNEPLPFVKVILVNGTQGAITDTSGFFIIDKIKPGVYDFKVVADGFKPFIFDDITITNARSVEMNASLEIIVNELKEVKVQASPFKKPMESPVSLKTLNATEIERLPGANRDVSKVIQALPGVASRATFRNDIIIRGGSPGENKFYLDGIEVPNINHFATQGSSGGPVGLLNVNFIREVDFYAGAFPANYANGVSSVLSFKQKNGNKDALIANFALGSSDIALTLDGPLGKKADFIFSARRSYLQFLFSALKLPFLPTYNDAQFKFNYNINKKNRISLIGVGALDDFVLNTKVNNGVKDSNRLEYNNFILGNIPTQDQWNYTIGINYQHFSKNGIQNFIVSRNMLKNISKRYKDNIENEANKILDYSSFEAENKIRFENTYNKNGWKWMIGAGYEYARYNSQTFNRIAIMGVPQEINFKSDLFVSKYALFTQLSKAVFNERLNLSLGLRTDIADYNKYTLNPLEQLSPMFSMSVRLTERWSINANVSRFHQLPAYTILGYRDSNSVLVNKQNEVKYIRADHFVLGAEYLAKFNARFTLEGFYKNYSRYPFSLRDSISLANVGSDFGVVGNEPVVSNSKGRSYGLEFLYQQKMIKGFYAILAYTYVVSEFQDKNNKYLPSSWDSRHIVSITGGKRFNKGWEIGFRWLFSGGSPYTPYDVSTSSLKQVWDINGRGILDYNQINNQREANFHQLNVRVDKKFYWNKFSLNLYLDIQNLYGYKTKVAPLLLVEKDANGNPITDPTDPTRYKTKLIKNTSGIIQPTLGIIFEFSFKKKVKANEK